MHEEDFVSFLRTVNLWTDTVILHGQKNIYPFLDEAGQKLCQSYFFSEQEFDAAT
jgi:hypothetical protein